MSCEYTIVISAPEGQRDDVRAMLDGWEKSADRLFYLWESRVDLPLSRTVFMVLWNYGDPERIKSDCAKLDNAVSVMLRSEYADVPTAIPTGTVIA